MTSIFAKLKAKKDSLVSRVLRCWSLVKKYFLFGSNAACCILAAIVGLSDILANNETPSVFLLVWILLTGANTVVTYTKVTKGE